MFRRAPNQAMPVTFSTATATPAAADLLPPARASDLPSSLQQYDHDGDNYGDTVLLLTDQSLRTDPTFRFAGGSHRQPWSSSGLLETGTQQSNAATRYLRVGRQDWTHDAPSLCRHLQPGPLAHSGKQNVNRRRGTDSSCRIRLAESAVFAPSVRSQLGSPMRKPVRRLSGNASRLCGRRMPTASETLPLVIHAQKKTNAATGAQALLSTSSNGYARSSSCKTKSPRSIQSSGDSSSSGRNSPPISHRKTRKKESREAIKPPLKRPPRHKDQPTSEPIDQFRREGDKDARVHASANETKERSDETKERSDARGAMSPPGSTTASLQLPRSPLRWSSVISLKPFNPSHLPRSHRGNPPSRSQSQRSRPSPRANGGSGSRSNPITESDSTAAAGQQKQSRPVQSRQIAGQPAPAKSNQKLPNTRSKRRYWVLNPLQWLDHCRKEDQVIEMATIFNQQSSFLKLDDEPSPCLAHT